MNQLLYTAESYQKIHSKLLNNADKQQEFASKLYKRLKTAKASGDINHSAMVEQCWGEFLKVNEIQAARLDKIVSGKVAVSVSESNMGNVSGASANDVAIDVDTSEAVAYENGVMHEDQALANLIEQLRTFDLTQEPSLKAAINASVSKHLAPSWVKFFAPEAQERALQAMQAYEEWPQFFLKNQSLLEAMKENKEPGTLLPMQKALIVKAMVALSGTSSHSDNATDVTGSTGVSLHAGNASNEDFSSAALIEKMRDLDPLIKSNQKELREKFTTLAQTAIEEKSGSVDATGAKATVKLGWSAIKSKVKGTFTKGDSSTAGKSLKEIAEENVKKAIAEKFAAELGAEEFLAFLEPFFSYTQYQTICNTLRTTADNYEQRLAIANALVAAAPNPQSMLAQQHGAMVESASASSSSQAGGLEPEKLISEFKGAYQKQFPNPKSLKTLNESLEEGFIALEKASIVGLRDVAKAKFSIELPDEEVDSSFLMEAIARHIMIGLLPLYIKNFREENQALVKQKIVAYEGWHDFYQENHTAFDSVRAIAARGVLDEESQRVIQQFSGLIVEQVVKGSELARNTVESAADDEQTTTLESGNKRDESSEKYSKPSEGASSTTAADLQVINFIEQVKAAETACREGVARIFNAPSSESKTALNLKIANHLGTVNFNWFLLVKI